MRKIAVLSLLTTFSFILASLIGSLIIFISILFVGYIHIIENNIFVLIFEIIMISFTITSFLFLIPKIMRKVDNEI